MDDSVEVLMTAIGDRYRIESKVGVGGSATVYKALDLKHDSPVAIKVLHPEVAELLGRKRFLREIAITRKLTHPFILPIHDSGAADHLLFYVMPYVDGTLRDVLQRDEHLPVDTALRIAREVADAIDHAHQAGFIHRDIKPENILLQAGHAAVSDFGLARVISDDEGENLTRSGVSVGTPAYMSPEQASGDAIDERSDIYSLGCVLYEMLTGQPPYDGGTSQKTLEMHRSSPIPSASAFRPALPANLERTLDRALAKRAEDRFSSAAEFCQSFSQPAPKARRSVRYAVGLGVAAVMVLGGIQVKEWVDGMQGDVKIESLVVLPLENISGDPSQQYIADGIQGEMVSAIARVGEPLRVVLIAHRDRGQSAQDIARELNVNALLEGTVLQVGDQVRITVKLVEAESGRTRWSDSYEGLLSDVLFLQRDVATEVARQIHGELSPAQQGRVYQAHSVDPEAFLLYLEGRHLWNERTPESIRAALDRYESAVRIDPSFAAAYAGIADAIGALGMQGEVTLDEAGGRARAAAQKALDLNASLSEAHASLGNVLQNYEWDWAGAEEEYRRAIELNPSSSTAHLWLALLLAQSGSTDLSLQEARIARELDPQSMPAIVGVDVCRYYAGQYDQVIQSLLVAREKDPDYATLYRLLAGAYLQREDDAKATQSLQGYFVALGDSTTAKIIGRLFEAGGIEGVARGLLSASLAQRKVAYVSAVRIAELYALIGDTEEALRWLSIAYSEKDVDLNRLNVDPIFDGLRADPRFDELLKRPLFQNAWVTANSRG